MESNFNRDFEEYLKRNADQYRMIPSDKVWNGINRSLHGRRRWYGLGLALLLLLTSGSVTWVMISNSNPSNQNVVSQARVKPYEIIQPVNPRKKAITEHPPQDMSALLTFSKKIQEEQKNRQNASSEPDNNIADTEAPAFTINFTPASRSNNSIPESANRISQVLQERNMETILNPVDRLPFSQQPTLAQATIKDEPAEEKKTEVYTADPLTIESVFNSFKPKKLDRSIRWQIYFTPTVSYRKLSENKAFLSTDPFGSSTNYPFAALSDVNKAVVHKPDFGFQLGVSAGYPLTKNLTVTGGLQFNINRYDIKAFVYNGEQATINLSGGAGNTSNSVTAWTYYRNYNGYKSDWLNNFYFSVSAPIGVEMKVMGKKKTYLGVAGTIQPTYILSDRAYLISTDYKNYAEVPWLIRHVNINTSFETFVSYTNKRNTKWQIGPQVRYQVLSSFQSKYPVKENLFDFGVKLGVTLNN